MPRCRVFDDNDWMAGGFCGTAFPTKRLSDNLAFQILLTIETSGSKQRRGKQCVQTFLVAEYFQRSLFDRNGLPGSRFLQKKYV
ncbi:MAG: hypothetical protein ABS95_01475 [Verrucomicrobia bacterium SCN 57-15]|nr:MAG: hypothetical protein ABS95_01475 [Verrucomicrobia bacterium SCN 57-15]